MSRMVFEPAKGMSFFHAARQAVDTAARQGWEVELVFDDIRIFVSPESCHADICTIYDLKCQLNRAEARNRSYK